nr:PH domain-containing protein [Sphingomonas jejuensis]
MRFRYTIGDDALVIEQGVISRQRRVIPFERVQDIDVERGPIARATGTALVKVETGGGGKDEGTLDVVTLAEVERLRAAIRGWRGAAPATDAAATEVAASPPDQLIYAMPISRVVLSGVLGFSLVSIAVIFGALQYVEPLVEGTRYDVYDFIREQVGSRRIDPREAATGARMLATAAFVASLVGAALVLGFVTGIVLALLRDFGFRLSWSGAAFRVRRGLLTIREVQVPRGRVQRVILKAPLLLRLMKYRRVELGTIGGASEMGGSHVVAPLARSEEINRITDLLHLDAAPAGWRRGHGLMVLQRSGRLLTAMLTPMVVLGVLVPWTLPLVPVVLIPILAVGWLAWRGERHAIEQGALHVRNGILGIRHVIVPMRRIQSVTIRRGWIERAIGLSSVIVDVAGASTYTVPVVSGLVPDDARRLAAALLIGRRG